MSKVALFVHDAWCYITGACPTRPDLKTPTYEWLKGEEDRAKERIEAHRKERQERDLRQYLGRPSRDQP